MAELLDAVKRKARIIVQTAFTVVTNGYTKGFSDGGLYRGPLKSVCVPGLNCYSCPGALGACPLGSLQNALGGGGFKAAFYVTGFLMLTGAFLGRIVCGWLCPFGLFQELLHKLPLYKRGRKRRRMKRLPGDRWLRWLKYALLAVFVILLPAFAVDFTGQGQPWFCEYICPSGTLMAGIPQVALNEGLRDVVGWLYAWKLLILAVLAVLSVFIWRPFCRYICPLGAVYGLFNPVALYRFKLDADKCDSCDACRRVCKADISPYKTPNSIECMRCGDCLKVCPRGALTSTSAGIVRLFDGAGRKKINENNKNNEEKDSIEK